jgi:hypothetical protein
MRFLALFGFLAGEAAMVIYLARRIKMGERAEARTPAGAS